MDIRSDGSSQRSGVIQASVTHRREIDEEPTEREKSTVTLEPFSNDIFDQINAIAFDPDSAIRNLRGEVAECGN
jgi:hypothetical protein